MYKDFLVILLFFVLAIPSILSAADFTVFRWNSETTGTLQGEWDLGTLGSGKTEATFQPAKSNEVGFRLVMKVFSIPTEFSFNGISNSGGLTSGGEFQFKGVDFDTSQPMKYSMDTEVIDWFPRFPVLKKRRFGVDAILGVKAVFLDTTVEGTEDGTGNPVSSNLTAFVPVPMIGARVYLGDLRKGKFRIEAMARYFRMSLYETRIKALDAEIVTFAPIGANIDVFGGWRWREQDITFDYDENNRAGSIIDSDGLFYGLRYRF